MNENRKLWRTLIVIVVMCFQHVAASNVVDLFVKAPRSVLPLLEQSTRLDMVDYYRSGMSTPSSNVMDGHARVTAMSDRSLTIDISDASTVQMILLSADGRREILCCIFTLKTPQPDSWMEFYNTDWSRLEADKYFKEPVISDWLTKDGLKHSAEIKEKLPFMLSSYVGVYPDQAVACELIIKNEIESYLGAEQYDEIKPWVRTELVYSWNGKTFKRK